MTDTLWQETWDFYAGETAERQPTFDPADYYRSGRASKAWPDKEGPEWWAENGPKFVETWVAWRDNCGLDFAEFPNPETGELVPGIELEAHAYGPEGLIVKSVTDRVMTDATDLFVVDLKTGSMTQPWPLQLALNVLCLDHTFGVRPKWGGYWSARKGGVETWHDLTRFTDAWLWDKVWKAREIRDRQLFIPSPNNLCKSACGVRDYCVAMGGHLSSSFTQSVSMTHETPNQGETEDE